MHTIITIDQDGTHRVEQSEPSPLERFLDFLGQFNIHIELPAPTLFDFQDSAPVHSAGQDCTYDYMPESDMNGPCPIDYE